MTTATPETIEYRMNLCTDRSPTGRGEHAVDCWEGGRP